MNNQLQQQNQEKLMETLNNVCDSIQQLKSEISPKPEITEKIDEKIEIPENLKTLVDENFNVNPDNFIKLLYNNSSTDLEWVLKNCKYNINHNRYSNYFTPLENLLNRQFEYNILNFIQKIKLLLEYGADGSCHGYKSNDLALKINEKVELIELLLKTKNVHPMNIIKNNSNDPNIMKLFLKEEIVKDYQL